MRHIKALSDAGIDKLKVPAEYMVGKRLARAIVDTDTGEEVIPANGTLTEERLELLVKLGIKKFDLIYTNDLDQGAYISDTLEIDPTSNDLEAMVEIYRMMRPGEPPTKEAANNLFQNYFLQKSVTIYPPLAG